ncbi:hypothetical protein [Ramlibacter sp.]|uniref:hypothetical protein n=1 Tax=Ramlibacter sp. TaxID=1917967 RepID=UPI003D0CA9F3
MSKNALIGVAGVHYVASELSRRGMVALPTIRNTAAYDIVALNAAGTKHANIQVKASSKKVSFFPMPPPEKVRPGPRDVYVLVRWLVAEERYEGFLLSGRQARAAVEASCEYQSESIRRGTLKAVFPCIYVGLRDAVDAARWNRAWEQWEL